MNTITTKAAPFFKGRAEDSYWGEMTKKLNPPPIKIEPLDTFESYMSSRESVLKNFASVSSNDNAPVQFSDNQPSLRTELSNTLNNLEYSKDKDTLYFQILKAYEPRQYHNTNHLKNMLRNLYAFLDTTHIKINKPDIFKFAIFMHDFFNGIPQDVAKSAEHAKETLKNNSNITKLDLNLLKKLIVATGHKRNLDNATLEEKLIADLDLAVLSSQAPDYEIYSNAIRNEYKDFDNKIFAKGRTSFLKALLKQKNIYHTDFFKKNFEKLARRNINIEIAKLIK